MIEIRHKESGRVVLRLENDTVLEAAAAGLVDRADLRGANLRGWDLSEIDFGHADLSAAELSRASLVGARLDRADLDGADLWGARFDHRTEWPPGFEPQEHGAVKLESRSGTCRLDPRHRELRAEAGRQWKESMARLRRGQAAVAIRELRRALPESQSSEGEAAYAALLQGLIRMLKRHSVKALAEFREAIHRYPHLAVGHVALAYTLLLRGKPNDAFAAYQRAIQVDPHDRDLYLPLLHAFGQSDRLKAQFEVYEAFLFPTAEQPVSAATVPNPVELLLDQQPDQLERGLCALVLGELIEGRPITAIPSHLLERRQWLDYAVKTSARYINELAGPIPQLASIWEFVSGSGCQVEYRIMGYWCRMEEQGFDREQIKRRMEIVRSFEKLCVELGHVRDEEDDSIPDGWV